MEKKIEINYNWECDQEIDIPQKHKETLINNAHDRIFEMIKKDHCSGELCTSVRYGKEIIPEEDKDEGLTYSGSWSISYDKQ